MYPSLSPPPSDGHALWLHSRDSSGQGNSISNDGRQPRSQSQSHWIGREQDGPWSPHAMQLDVTPSTRGTLGRSATEPDRESTARQEQQDHWGRDQSGTLSRARLAVLRDREREFQPSGQQAVLRGDFAFSSSSPSRTLPSPQPNSLASPPAPTFQATMPWGTTEQEEGGLRAAAGQAEDPEETEEEEESYLAVFFSSGKIGAAVYHCDSASLRVLADVEDLPPEMRLLKTLLRQVNPKNLIVCASQPKLFLRIVREMCGMEPAEGDTLPIEATETQGGEEEAQMGEGEESIQVGQDWEEEQEIRLLASNHMAVNDTVTTTKDASLKNTEAHFLPGKCFKMALCKRRVMNTTLPSDQVDPETTRPVSRPEGDHFIFINSLLNLQAQNSIRAAGALLCYLDANRVGCPNLHGRGGGAHPECLVMSVAPLTVEEVLTLDDTSLAALQIFNSNSGPSGSRKGSWNRSREGLSVYGLLNRCKSMLGAKYLRYLCRCPLRNEEAILQRQEVVAYLSNPAQADLRKSLQDCLNTIKNVPKILKKVALAQASVQDWKCLKKSLQGALSLSQLCQQQRDANIELLIRLGDCASEELFQVVELLERVMDVPASDQRGKFTVNVGLDNDLDEKRRMHNGLPDLLLEIAREEIDRLPDFMQSCTMAYLPQIGYLLAVTPWAENLTEEDFVFPDMEFMFVSDGVPYFKTAQCKELDESLGDTATHIADHETRIVLKLSTHVLNASEKLLTPIRYAALLDCLLALAAASLEYGWVRPILGGEELCIRNGRHPLQELCTSTFVPNPTHLGDDGLGDAFKVAVLTGPNACGKSIYLKQVGLIAYLAHLGSNVPADAATIPILDRIFTRIQTVESLSLGLSAFMVDVNQVSSALRCATRASLVLLDEFGKGTSAVDGQALFAAALDDLANRGEDTPFVLATTHLHQTQALLGPDARLLFNTFECLRHEGKVVFLYKLQAGCCTASEAHHAAKTVGVEDSLLQRSLDVMENVRRGKEVEIREDVYPIESMEMLAEEFLDLNIENSEEKLSVLLSRIKEMNL